MPRMRFGRDDVRFELRGVRYELPTSMKVIVKRGHGCPGRAGQSAQAYRFKRHSTQGMPLGIGSCARQNQTSICCLGL